MMRKTSDSKTKWKLGLNKLRRQSVVSEPSIGETTVMEEETTEVEMQDYFAKLKKRTGLNQLWSGRKFMEAIDRDPDIDLSEEPRLRSSTLKQLTLDSDEEDLHEFIQNLSDYERSVITEKEEESSRASSSASDIDLMKNINFADAGAADYSRPGRGNNSDYDDDRDFMPLVVRPEFDDESGNRDHSESSQSNIFKTGNINFVTSDVSSVKVISDRKKSMDEEVTSDSGGTAAELTEEILEVYDESRVNTPLTPGKSHDYTSSKFESYESDAKSESRVSKHYGASESKSIVKKEDKNRKTLKKSDNESSKQSNSVRVRRRKGTNAKHSRGSDVSESSRTSASTRTSRGDSSNLSGSSSSSTSGSTSSSRSSKTVSHTKSNGTRSLQYAKKPNIPGRKKEKNGSKASSWEKQRRLKVSLNDLGVVNAEMFLDRGIAPKYLDPSPIAATVVDQEALEAVTSYNPAMIALNDLLRHQIQLTRQYIDNSWRLYRAYAEPEAKGTHRYTTLKGTIKYMKKNAPSVISYEEALRQVNDNAD